MSDDKRKEIEELRAKLNELEESVKKDETIEEEKKEKTKTKSGNIIGVVVAGIAVLVLLFTIIPLAESSKDAAKSIRDRGITNPTLDRLVLQYYDSDLSRKEVIKILQDRGFDKGSIEAAIDDLW